MEDVPGRVLTYVLLRQYPGDLLGGQQLGRLERMGLLDAEGTDRGPAQLRKVCPATQSSPRSAASTRT